MDDSLEALEPESSAITYNGQRLEIQPLVGSQIAKMVRLCQPILKSVSGSGGMIAKVFSDENGLSKSDDDADGLAEFGDAIFSLIGEHGDRVFEAIALAARLKTEEVSEAPLDEIIKLGFKAFSVNRDFFVQKVLPLLGERARKYVGDGKTPLPPYSAAGTPEKIS